MDEYFTFFCHGLLETRQITILEENWKKGHFLPKVLPALNASQLHHNINSPTTALEGLPIGGSPRMSHRPRRGPIMMAATKAKEKELC